MVKRLVVFGLLLGFGPACVTTREAEAKSPVASVAAPPAEAGKLAKPFLWSVSSHETKQPVGWLLGTVHVSVDAKKELPARVWAAFEAANCFVMEADQDKMDAQAVLAMAKRPDAAKKLSQQVKPATWSVLAKRLAPMLAPASLDDLQPWFAGLAYMQTLLPRDVPPMDGTLLAEARKAGKKIQFLEDWREAMAAFARVTTAEDLEDIVGKDDESKKELASLVDAYRSGDEAKIDAAIKSSNERGAGKARAEEKEKALLEGRNLAWLPRLAKILRTDRCFVAVGTGHLVGAKGLPTLLKDAGFTAVRVP